MPAPRAAVPLLLLLACVAPSAARAGDPSESADVPFTGPLADPRDARDGKNRWTRILDAETGAPIRDARLLWYPEQETAIPGGPHLIGVGVADENGLARVPDAPWSVDSHWVAESPDGSRAPDRQYGCAPRPVTFLRKGSAIDLIVQNPFGDPIVGADAEWFIGCGHAPALRFFRTGEDGDVPLGNVAEDSDEHSLGHLWIRAEGCLSDYVGLDGLPALGILTRWVALVPGATLVGRVVDPAGRPLEGVVLKSWQTVRGPLTVTDRDGRFRLVGVRFGHGVRLYHPSQLADSAPTLEGWLDGVERTVVLSPYKILDPPRGGGRLRVEFRAPEGASLPEVVPFRVLRLSDGLARREYTERGLGAVEIDVSAGEHRLVSASGPEDPFEFDPVEVAPTRLLTRTATVALRPRARLRIDANPNPDATYTLVVAGEPAIEAGGDVATWRPYLSPTARAALHARPFPGGPTYVVPVPPAKDGERVVALLSRGKTFIHVKGADPAGDIELTYEGRPVGFARKGDLLDTSACGPLEVVETSRDGETEKRVTVEVPLRRELNDLHVDLTGVAAVPVAQRPDAELEFFLGDGTPATDVELVIYSPGGGAQERSVEGNLARVRVPARVEARRDGFVTLVRWVTKPVRQAVRWRSATLDLTVVGEDDAAVPALVEVDGMPYDATESGTLKLEGLTADEHVVRAIPSLATSGGRKRTVSLEAGKTAAVRIRCPP